MIIGITGSLCSGKSELANYLCQTYDFEAVNLLDVFKKRLSLKEVKGVEKKV
jgi:dephospho-CoA kinase